MEIIIKDLKELAGAAETLLTFAGNRKVWCFYGELGAGKTTFIKEICTYLKVEDSVTSPTYSLVNEYTYPASGGTTVQYLYHLDLYRLNRIEEALDIGIEEYLYRDSYCFIEWAQIIEPILPAETLEIHIEIVEDAIRRIVCS